MNARLHRTRASAMTLLELLVAMAVLSVVMIAIFQTISSMQRIWTQVRERSDPYRTTRTALDTVARRLTQATLAARFVPDLKATSTGPAYVRESDLHFVFGPADELLKGNELSGHAIFFQGPFGEAATEEEGDLQYNELRESLCAWGYFVELIDDKPLRPPFLREQQDQGLPSRRRFRLMEFRQPAHELSMFQLRRGDGAPEPELSKAKSQADVYRWFQEPLGASDVRNRCVSVVAENVLAVLCAPYEPIGSTTSQTAVTAVDGVYDSRRFQWDAGGETSDLTRHRLPRALRLTVVATSEDDWAKLTEAQIDDVSARLRNLVNGRFQDEAKIEKDLQSLRSDLDKMKLAYRVLSTIVRPAEQ